MAKRFVVFMVEFVFFRGLHDVINSTQKHERYPNTILHFKNLDDGTLPRISALDGGKNSILKPRKRNISAVVQLSGLLSALDSREDSRNVSTERMQSFKEQVILIAPI